ncbi:MAG: NADH-quinone oxidoreductase subunit D, partial [Actinomycetota bacterium]
EAYRALGFHPTVREGGDALARLRVRLAEIEQSLEISGAAGSLDAPDPDAVSGVSGTGAATIETPRGPAALRVTLSVGEVMAVELESPSARHLALIENVAEQQELADALVGVASLDLSPWEAVR